MSEPQTMLRPLGVAELLDGAVRAVRADARICVALALPFAVLRAALGLVVSRSLVGTGAAASVEFLAGLLVTGVVAVGLGGLLTPVITARLLGRPLPPRVAVQRMRPLLLRLAVLGVVVAVVEVLGVIALVVGGVWLWGVWAVAAPALAAESLGPFAALRRSFDLVRRRFWATWGVRALGALLGYVLSALITVPFQLLASYLTGTDPLRLATDGISDPNVYLGVLAFGTLVSSVMVLPISAAIDTLLYTDLRMRAEGMDIALALAARDAERRPAVRA